MGSRGALGLVVVLAFAGCTKDVPRMPAACAAPAGAMLEALRPAPRRAALADGTLLSECVRRARSDAELQNLGLALTEAADTLGTGARGGDAGAAGRLGFLAGAVRRGAAGSNGVTAELSRRIDAAARGLEGAAPAVQRALQRGLDAGRARG